MITYKTVDTSHFEQYDKIPMKFSVSTEYKIEKINNGLGGFLIKDVPVTPYVEDISKYQ